jgi:hypothetical protein
MLMHLFPSLAHGGSEIRQWTVREWHPLVPVNPLFELRSHTPTVSETPACDEEDFVPDDELEYFEDHGL